MYCRHCGNEMVPDAVVCVRCGAPKYKGNNFCPSCKASTGINDKTCSTCGVLLSGSSTQKSKITAGLLALFVGAWGVHNFYLGYTAKAVIQLVMMFIGIVFSWLIIPAFLCMGAAVWALIEGIMILTGSLNKDGKGNPLAE